MAASPDATRLVQPSVNANTLHDENNGPLITGWVQNTEITFLVDTGANVSILKPSALQRIPPSKQPSLDPVNTDMSLADIIY